MMNTDASKTLGTYRIPAVNMDELKKLMDRVAKRLGKLGLPALTMTVGEPFEVPFLVNEDGRDPREWTAALAEVYGRQPRAPRTLAELERDGRIRYRKFHQVTIEGQTPRLAGYTFVATLQHLRDEETGKDINMLRTVPSFEGELPAQYREASAENCDHCHKRIRTRRETFIVRHESGEWKQVGRNCTQDFLGGIDPHKVAEHLELILRVTSAAGDAEGEGFGFGGGGEYRYALRTFLAVVAMFIRSEGWISRGRAKQSDGALSATANDALTYLGPAPRDAVAAREHHRWVAAHPVLDEDKETADKAYTYAREDLADKGDRRNDYEHNLYVACVQSSVDHKLAGIAASLVPYYLREVEKKVLREVELRRVADSDFVGKVGDRLVMQVQVSKIITIGDEYSQFGMSYLHKMIDTTGNLIVWFSSDSKNNLKPGATVWVKATVKKHEVRQNVKQTSVNRLVEMTEDEAKAEQAKAAKKAERAAKKAAKGQDRGEKAADAVNADL